MTNTRTRFNLIQILTEILIVVIGIFIAFQINKWSDDRKQNAEEIKSLELLKKDLLSEKSFFEFIKADMKKGIAYLNDISGRKQNNLDSLVYYLEREFFHPKLNSSYVNLKFGGKLNLLSNVELKNQLVWFYEAFYEYLEAFGNSHQAFVYNDIRAYIIGNIKVDENLIVVDNRVDMKLKDEKLLNLVNYQIYTMGIIEKRLDVSMIENLIETIDKELKTLKGA